MSNNKLDGWAVTAVGCLAKKGRLGGTAKRLRRDIQENARTATSQLHGNIREVLKHRSRNHLIVEDALLSSREM